MILMSVDIIVCRFVLLYCTFSSLQVSDPFSFVVDIVRVRARPLVSDMSKLNSIVPK